MALAARLAKGSLYYGWYIVAVAFMIGLVSPGLISSTPQVFLKPMTEELGWNRGFFSLAVSLGGLLSAPLALWVGPIIDRRGARGPMLIAGLLIGAAFIGLGLVQTKWQFLVLRSAMAPLAMAGLGQLATQVTVSNWFVKKRGRALAITAMGMSTGWTVVPPLATYLIATLGWRQAWMVLGLLAWALVLAPAWLIVKRRPEDIGLLPDGGPTVTPSETQRRPAPEVTWTRQEAVRTPALWLLAFSLPLGMMGMSAITQHLYSYVTDMHFSQATAATVTMTIYLVAVAIKLPWGFVAERVSPRYCLATVFFVLGLGLGLLVLSGDNRIALYVVAGLLGAFWGGIPPLQGLLWAGFFGRMSLGRVQSLAMLVSAAFTPLGPVLAGYLWDVTGTYRNVFTYYMVPSVAAGVLLLLARPPRKKAAPETGAPTASVAVG